MSSRRFVRIIPLNVGINPVTFQVDPQEDFIDMQESYLEVELRVRSRIQFVGGGRVVMRFRHYLEVFHLSKLLIPGVQIQIDKTFVRIIPFNVGIDPVTFQADPQEDFIDMPESYLEVELRVMKDNNAALAAADLIGLANNLARTLLKQINVR